LNVVIPSRTCTVKL